MSDDTQSLDDVQPLPVNKSLRMAPKLASAEQSRTKFLSLSRELRHQILAYTYSDLRWLYTTYESVRSWSVLLGKFDDRLHEDIKFRAIKQVEAIMIEAQWTKTSIEGTLKAIEDFDVRRGFA